jgi:tripartite-type tricarboxylate transporter receptor subunit TctC
MELMAQSAGIELVHVPYRGSNETVAGMLAGDINATFNGVSNFVQLLAADKLRALAVATDQRSSQLPNVPTIKEATDGQLANVDTGSWFGLFVPAGTPDAIVQQVQKDVAAVMANPKVREAMETRGFIPVGSTPAQFSDTIKKEAVQWQKVIKAGNIKPE